jgi:predicted small secreted protein
MNSPTRRFLLVILLALESVIITGCANTGRGIKADAKHDANKVEDAVRH